MLWRRNWPTAQAIARMVSSPGRGQFMDLVEGPYLVRRLVAAVPALPPGHAHGHPAYDRSSCNSTATRPWTAASTPQEGQPTNDGTVSTTRVNQGQ